MKLATFTYNGRTRVGELLDDKIYSVSSPDISMERLIRRGITPTRISESFALDKVKLEAPLRPGKVIAIGLNYADHAAESGQEPPKTPLIFAKFPSSIIGPGDAITWRESITKEVDWEVELVVVIGKRAREVAEENAMNYVFGYTVGNDVSARDVQLKLESQWTRGKSLDTFCPLGPWIVTKDEIADPQNLNMKTVVNKKVMQDSNTKNLIFNVAQLISYCSRMFTLEPGDIIMTGTPPGVGMGRKPQVFLKDGDTVTVSIEGIGEMSNPCKIIAE